MTYVNRGCEPQNGPQDESDFWETVYPAGYEEKSLTDESDSEEGNDAVVDEAVNNMEVWTWAPTVLDEGRLSGEGTGVEVAGVVAAVLDVRQKYGFEFTFYKVEDEVQTPWEGGEEE